MRIDDARKIFRLWFVGNGLKVTSSKNMFIEDHEIFMVIKNKKIFQKPLDKTKK